MRSFMVLILTLTLYENVALNEIFLPKVTYIQAGNAVTAHLVQQRVVTGYHSRWK